MGKTSLLIALAFVLIVGAMYSNNKDKKVGYEDVIDVIAPSRFDKDRKEGVMPGGYISGVISKIIDGETIAITYKNRKRIVRLLYIDVPGENQRFSEEATEFLRKVAWGKQAKLIFETKATQIIADNEQLLAHVIIDDKSYLNGMIVRNGLARVESKNPNNSFNQYFMELLKQAVNGKVGVWSLSDNDRPFIKDRAGNYIKRT